MKNISTHHTDPLLLRLSEGDESAFREFFHTYSHHVYHVALLMTKSAELAEDMVQEIFLKIWLNRAALPGVENLKGYLFINARNHILNELRKGSHNLQFTTALLNYFSEPADNPEQALLRKESRTVLRQAIAHLPTRQRLIYQLSKEKGLKQDEIAAQLNISKHTVRNSLAQALQNIRHFLERAATGLVLGICVIEAFL